MGKHVQFQQQRHATFTQVTTNKVVIPAGLASTWPDDDALVNCLVSQGYVLHDVAGGDADLFFATGATLGNGDLEINFNRNLDSEWVKFTWLG